MKTSRNSGGFRAFQRAAWVNCIRKGFAVKVEPRLVRCSGHRFKHAAAPPSGKGRCGICRTGSGSRARPPGQRTRRNGHEDQEHHCRAELLTCCECRTDVGRCLPAKQGSGDAGRHGARVRAATTILEAADAAILDREISRCTLPSYGGEDRSWRGR